jgi:MerR family transcriptional regulator, light-induced transcriptional regulator
MHAVDRYIALALQPDVEGLAALVEATVAEHGTLACYDTLIRPALVEVGARWERDELTVGDEHLITSMTEQVLAGLVQRPAGSTHVAVVATTPGNRHRVGLVMIADALGLAGWQPAVLGAETPIRDIGHLARERGAALIALSLGLDEELGGLTAALETLRDDVGDQVHILVGGSPLARNAWEPPPGVEACSSATDAHAAGSLLLERLHSPA